MVVRENFSEELADLYITDLMAITEDLMKSDSAEAALATLGNSKRHETAESRAGRTGHDESDSHKPTTYARQC